MFRHNLLMAYRSLLRFKSTFFINLIGLSTGLACALAIYLWVNDELSFDKFHENDSRLFQVMSRFDSNEGKQVSDYMPGLLAEALVAEIPEIEYATAVSDPAWFGKFTLSVDNNNFKALGQYVGKDYLNIFSFDLIQGDKNQVLQNKGSIVISEDLAVKLFGTTQNIIGKSVLFQQDKQFLVSGVVKNVPANSTEQFDFLVPFELLKETGSWVSDWSQTGPHAYVVLKPGTNAEQVNAKIADFLNSKVKDNTTTLFLSPYSDKYLHGKYENGVQSGGRIEYVKLFSLIAFFILLIACINFMNLSTAKAARRMKEIGIKKTLGATRQVLVAQYLGESLLMSFLALVIALILLLLLLPQFNQITGKQLSLSLDANLILSLLGIAVLTGLIAGSYPALYLSGFNPIAVLKGKLNRSVGEVWARKGLVVFQFALSIIFIVSVLVVYKQIEYAQTKNLGYEKDNVIYFEKEGKVNENLESFLAQIKTIPGVMQASSIAHNMVGHNTAITDLKVTGEKVTPGLTFEDVAVNYDLLETLGIQIKEGRSFSRQFKTDDAAVIFNEAAIQAMGLQNPVGKTVFVEGRDRKIVGVAKDFHFQSFHENIKPLVFRLEPEYSRKIMVKIAAGQEQAVIEKLQEFYKTYNPGFVLDYTFLDEKYQAQYAAEQRVSVLSRYFAVLAILISCLGLFGLAAFTAERRRKEIGVRKVLGASDLNIIYLLSSDFTRLVVVAICISLPLSYLIVKHWLNNFEYRIDLQWWYFAGAGMAALLVAWLTVGSQAVKAASVNPVQSLKDE